jgi:hypothetical protein
MRRRMIRQHNRRMRAPNARERRLNRDGTVARCYYDEGKVVVAWATQLYYRPDQLRYARHRLSRHGQSFSQWLSSVAAFIIIILTNSHRILPPDAVSGTKLPARWTRRDG